ncbi:MAG: ISKra4 family transposase [Acetobacteraceae bacterium]
MRIRILLEITAGADNGPLDAAGEVMAFEKATERPEDLGLSIAEAKRLLTAAQDRIIATQVADWSRRHRPCGACGRPRRIKGTSPIVFRTLYGDVDLRSPRVHRCACQNGCGPATISPLREFIPGHVSPERLYLEAKWASLVPYAAAAELFADVLPVGAGANATTIRQHTLRVAERAESELAEERDSFVEGCPAEWGRLPVPEDRIAVGLDGGYVRDWQDRKSNFEVIVGQSIPLDRPSRYFGLVHGHDRKPKRRLFEMLREQGLQANQELTFLTDGGEEIVALTERISPEAEHVLDWFHITMRLTVLRQYARGVAEQGKETSGNLVAALERMKWFLWHGNTYRARQEADSLVDDVYGLALEYPHLGKFRRAAQEFATYIANNVRSLINYGERFRSGERISSCLAESTVNAVISKRFAKRQQMQWTPRGAHLLLQTRVRTLDGTLSTMFARWFPGLANDNNHTAKQDAA